MDEDIDTKFAVLNDWINPDLNDLQESWRIQIYFLGLMNLKYRMNRQRHVMWYSNVSIHSVIVLHNGVIEIKNESHNQQFNEKLQLFHNISDKTGFIRKRENLISIDFYNSFIYSSLLLFLPINFLYICLIIYFLLGKIILIRSPCWFSLFRFFTKWRQQQKQQQNVDDNDDANDGDENDGGRRRRHQRKQEHKTK